MEKTLRQHDSSCVRVVLFGPESTGKTTLSKQLANHFKTEWAPEYMREYLQDKWDRHKEVCTKEDLLPIAQGQIKVENKAIENANKVVFCDTNLLELQVYSEYYYNGYCASEIKQANQNNKYDLYLLTYIDTPWEDDDLRDRPNDRLELFRIFERQLTKNMSPYIVLIGSKEERLKTAIMHVEKLLLEV